MKDGIIYWDIDPVIFWITDSFPLKYYGLFFMTGLFLGYFIVKAIYKKENIPVQDLDSLLTYIILGILIGARLGHCLFYQPDYFLSRPLEMFLPIQKIGTSYQFIGYQGLASHGGGIGVLIAIFLYCKKYKVNILWLLDRVAIGTSVTGAFIRFGNFMNSEIYGKPTDGNWGVVFMRDDLIPRHPTQLYEAFSYLLISVILYSIYNSKRTEVKNGQLFGLFLILLFLARFIIEFFKENQVAFEDSLTLNMGQILSLPFIVAGILLIFWKRNNLMNTK
ncbi:prolipoprotein diacylglyceryl transferase [Zunongwangia endophytica]|uniref:Phosphatidylglycerol--prolipoprotein diacylglyceryl transferase n=1 Tax=Zunongwangia endophytica TaxID=1808945 RepID=A0ABV8H398_9FLAO|nr:prolipoprotein diacylglyceryl transferase [Zunongwangia endophytica]MDN3595947.1 prolipoprotein diacylglyceryl transferase [Zunongwangia endophytica]